MAEQDHPWVIQPGHGLGAMNLGASLQSILTYIKAEINAFPAIDVIYAPSEPLTNPVIVRLPRNGLRLRFDGPEQRLRLIEVMDFGHCQLVYKGSELVKHKEDAYTTTGPAFRRVYQIFGAAFPGEYLEPKGRSQLGTYVLSWPGVAFTFPLQYAAWSASKDHVSLLGSHAASPATHMAIFEGANWSEAKTGIYDRVPGRPRSMQLATRPRDSFPAEIEAVIVREHGHAELVRKVPASPFLMKVNQTTPEDLITELGPPDAKYKRDTKDYATEQRAQKRNSGTARSSSYGRYGSSQPSSYSSTGTDTFDADFDNEAEIGPSERASRETFWCYFSHGFDILVGPPSSSVPMETTDSATMHTNPYLVVTKIVLHGNVPGSYAFNRHRRLRWSLGLKATNEHLTSECNFDTQLKPALLKAFVGARPEAKMALGKVVNRTWNGDTTDGSFFLPDAEEDLIEGGSSEQWLSNTKLYHFPRLALEVLENGAVSTLTIT
ncbi:hypothetical protein AMS68_002354 [Peltaster fructicola]|uniref:Uncharacterized protein n=1 Tax=Peltaster fructicola TaxID=286661 RepID=A0A6H0XQ07_9PEZI|nr:hypothetical protein AMS68_002354 [Peltaster fructicola]